MSKEKVWEVLTKGVTMFSQLQQFGFYVLTTLAPDYIKYLLEKYRIDSHSPPWA